MDPQEQLVPTAFNHLVAKVIAPGIWEIKWDMYYCLVRDNEAVLNSATLFLAEMLQGLGNISLVISTNTLFILVDMGASEKRGSSLNLFKWSP